MEAVSKLRNTRISAQKMRLVADLLRGENIYTALNILRYNPKHASKNLEKLLNNFYELSEHSLIMNETDRTSVALLFHENIIDLFRKRT